MRRLTVESFLVIEMAQLELRPFTLLIGPQANGKSVIAKVGYLLENFLASTFVEGIEQGSTKTELGKAGAAAFEQLFPRYAWSDTSFRVRLEIDEEWVELSRSAGARATLKVNYSQNLAAVHRRARREYDTRRSQFLEEAPSRTGVARSRARARYEVFHEVLKDYLFDSKFGDVFAPVTFIPASRSFFANLQKNVFSFLANHISIDPLIKEFGSEYERVKWYFEDGSQSARRSVSKDVKESIETILRGRYVHEGDQDWIHTGKRKTNLAQASSGQQEALPMLLMLAFYSTFSGGRSGLRRIYIEEPEAHLFPISQKRIIDLLAMLRKQQGFTFFLTTHSPYILTALNNLILGGSIIERFPNSKMEVCEVMKCESSITLPEMGAYTVEDGLLRSVIDEEQGLIGTSVIDSVSEEFGRIFERLLDIEEKGE